MKISARLSVAAILLAAILTACSPASEPNPPAPVSGETTSAVPVTETSDSSGTESTSVPDSTSGAAESTKPVTETATDTETAASSEETGGEEEPEFVNPLTGLAAEKDLSATRPAAIMINNIKVSCPQIGVSQADVMYECLVEGGYTRLMMLTADYESLPEVGSVRSARDYYLDLAADYDAIYVHAGGSTYAYDSIAERSVNNLDGVNMYLPTTFYRDQDRAKTMGLEHSLMTTGEKIAEGVAYRRYRTEMTNDFDYPLDFVKYGTTVSFTDASLHIRIPYSVVQTTDFVYDAESGKYLRYQFDGEKHIDGATNEQLSFENVMLLFCETGLITGDPYNRIDVGTTGEGTGYYATRGTYIPITWKKDSHETPVKFFDADGNELLLNRGKTFVSVCPTSIRTLVSFNYKK